MFVWVWGFFCHSFLHLHTCVQKSLQKGELPGLCLTVTRVHVALYNTSEEKTESSLCRGLGPKALPSPGSRQGGAGLQQPQQPSLSHTPAPGLPPGRPPATTCLCLWDTAPCSCRHRTRNTTQSSWLWPRKNLQESVSRSHVSGKAEGPGGVCHTQG